MQEFGWYPLVLLFPNPPVPLSFLSWQYQEHQLWYHYHFHVPRFLQFSSKVDLLMSFFRFLSVFLFGQPRKQSPQYSMFSFSIWLLQGLIARLRLGDLFQSQSPGGICGSHSQRQSLVCAYTICSFAQISSLTHFSVDHLCLTVVSSLIVFLR